jgi:hypothetical protein
MKGSNVVRVIAGLMATGVAVTGTAAWADDAPSTSPGLLAAPVLKLRAWLEEPSGNKAIEGDESGTLVVRIRNEGDLATRKLQLLVEDVDLPDGLTLAKAPKLRDLGPRAEQTVHLALVGARTLAAGEGRLSLSVLDGDGYDSPRTQVRFTTNAYRAPALHISQAVAIDGNNGTIERGEQLQVQVEVVNRGGVAQALQATLTSQHPGLEVLGESRQALGTLQPGARAIGSYNVLIAPTYDGPPLLPIRLDVAEAYPENACRLPVELTLQQRTARLDGTKGPGQRASEEASDVDTPTLTTNQRRDVVAVVIGVERYLKDVPEVPFARRDAQVAREYFERTLGARPQETILLMDEQATLANIRTALEGRLADRVAPGKTEVVVYFAGHGAPDVKTRLPYMIPYDGNPAYPGTSCYAMTQAYAALARLNAKGVTVILDACFSGGAARQDSSVTLVANARPLYVEPQATGVPPGINVLAAATGTQLSSGLEAERHGIFTYFLLKGLQGDADLDRDRQVTLAELQAFIGPRVARAAKRLNREQHPVLIGGDADAPLFTF